MADFVSLHCPLTEATRGIVDAEFLARDEAGGHPHQHRARRAHRRGGAGGGSGRVATSAAPGSTSSRSKPPPPNHPLTDPRAPWPARVVVTPHIGWGTVEARRRLVTEVARNLEAFLEGGRRATGSSERARGS